MTGELTNERLLVTGGAGFIGSNFVHLLLKERPHVHVTVLDALTYAGNMANLNGLEDQIAFRRGSVADPDLMNELVAECDIVVHFAAESHNDNALLSPREFLTANIVGTFEIMEAARRHGVRVHLISTDEVYGDLPLDDDSRFTLETPFNPSSPYSWSKAAGAMMLGAWVRSYKSRVTLSNCSNNYGPRQHIEKFIPRVITNILADIPPKIYGKGQNVRDWIHVDDHNLAVLAILERSDNAEAYLIGADCQLDNRYVVKAILELMGRPADWFEEVNDRPGHDERYAIDPSKIMEDLGWAPVYTDFYDGLSNTIKWYTDNRDWWQPQKEAVEAKYALQGQ